MTKETPRTRWWLLATFVSVALACVAGWMAVTWARARSGAPSNAIMVIAPYWYNGTWVFDDPAVGLRREPFVAGIPEMINRLVKDIPDSRDGFRLTFSANPFPGYQNKLTWLRGDSIGNFYRLEADPPAEGWICPAMSKYYGAPPKNIFVKADPKNRMGRP
jgi:hypothetical protein